MRVQTAGLSIDGYALLAFGEARTKADVGHNAGKPHPACANPFRQNALCAEFHFQLARIHQGIGVQADMGGNQFAYLSARQQSVNARAGFVGIVFNQGQVFFAPWRSSASISEEGVPGMPKPPIMMVMPSAIRPMASSIVQVLSCLGGLLNSRFHVPIHPGRRTACPSVR